MNSKWVLPVMYRSDAYSSTSYSRRSSQLGRFRTYKMNIAGIICYTCSLVIDIQCTRYKNAFNKRF